MAFRKISLDGIPSTQNVVTIGASGFGFSASFIKSNRLENKVAVSFYFDDEDQYKVGFEFHDDLGVPDSLKITHGSDSATKRVGATGVINKSRILKSIQSDPDKNSRIFELKVDPISKLFYIMLRPAFEFSIAFSRKGDLPDGITGIYRYRDIRGDVIYIGKGLIKDRASSPERREWGIHKIEYSVIESDDLCFKWESFYLESFRQEEGVLPPLNRIGGRSSD